MIAALFVAGPAALLAVMAWAVDRFMPIPSSTPQIDERNARSAEMSVVRQPTMPKTAPVFEAGMVRKMVDGADDAQEFIPLARALQRYEAKRSRSMAEDHYPDPIRGRYEDLDSLELQTQRIVFERDGRVRLEARSVAHGRSQAVATASSEVRATRLIP